MQNISTSLSPAAITEASSSSATEIYIDLDTPQVREFRTRYKLLVTITDKSGSLDAVAFSFVAEDLVELDAAQASQNMKIDPADHPTALNNAIGKTKIFAIGMNTDTSSKFPISYVLKKSFTIEPTMSVPMLTDREPLKNKEVLQLPPPAPHTDNPSTTIHNTGASSKSTPPEISLADKTPTEKTSSTRKRAIDFTKDSIEETRSKKLQHTEGKADFPEDSFEGTKGEHMLSDLR
ncbi:hypothetical protein OsJ_17713 [Oryza sativa Japonica Group]|uniref:Uncharacterized protein n=1 Tax=Oryza sativa subsp. japonica TaxID=39947 RepID=Q6F2R4_ORYSJ|nr:hypothetical protein [Oryza sativa Japonica Group]EEE62908.1 hypothetical protein OsJ_17713 [Oryza sativa Japonica Group]